MKITNKFIYFWGDWTSNFYPCHFVTKDKKTFFCTEQYFMYMKAITFEDYEIAEKILLETKPSNCKKLGRQVRNYDDKIWNEKRYQVMLDANMMKFSQNLDLKDLLLNDDFEGKHFVEASPYDAIWGIKCSVKDAKDDKSNWKGLNLLGKVLDEVRLNLKNK